MIKRELIPAAEVAGTALVLEMELRFLLEGMWVFRLLLELSSVLL